MQTWRKRPLPMNSPTSTLTARKSTAPSEQAWPIVPFVFSVFAIFTSMVAVFVVANNRGTKIVAAASVAAIEVTLKEFSISPAELTAPPGDVAIRITNSGTAEHDFEVVGQGKTKRLAPGQADVLSLKNVPAGHYAIRCNVPGHAAAGMSAMLMVSVGAKAGGSGAAEVAMTPDEMDASMAKIAKTFPAKTAGHGGDLLEPKVMPDGTKEFDITAKIVDWETEPGKIVKAWTYNGVVPAPTIKVNVGDKVRIVHHNQLEESTAIHFHGIKVPNAMDGVPPFTQDVIKPGATFTYEFTATEPAVGTYHSHQDAQVQVPNGMFGAFLIGDMPIPASTNVTKIDKEYVMVLNDAGNIGLSLNGKSFPATEPVALKVGQSMLVHYMNEGLMAHPMHLHQPSGLIIAKDGIPLTQPMPGDTINVAPGERYSVLYTPTEPGVWAWHCHILTHAEGTKGMFGMVTALIVT